MCLADEKDDATRSATAAGAATLDGGYAMSYSLMLEDPQSKWPKYLDNYLNRTVFLQHNNNVTTGLAVTQ
ncbi:hypothetical protein L917_20700 [Phytophthora nicotianae]|uniref:Uncharacterized protein n=2 Tax=Phytophthora nicotianae TaxID=4792 RepID=W2K053_PHYNI|nr:hypothetical protein L917_20700 [Phytophthora nicotianae]